MGHPQRRLVGGLGARLHISSQERPDIRRDGDQCSHSEQYVGNSIDQHNAEYDHGKEGKAQG
jgi:hypothetical protein